jgi:hypothetical protein
MRQFFTLSLIAGACIARLLSGTLVTKRLIVVAVLAGLMSSAAHAERLAQQRAMVTPQQAAVALKSSQEYLRAAGWQFQAMGPDGSSTWTNSDYGTVTLAKDGWLQLTNGQKVRPERVGLYLQGLVQGTITPAPSAPTRAPAPGPSETSHAQQAYYVSVDCVGKSGGTYSMNFDTFQQCNDYEWNRWENKTTGLCWRSVGSESWEQLFASDKDICLGDPFRNCHCNAHFPVQESQASTVTTTTLPPPAKMWHIWGRKPEGESDRQWAMLPDGPFTGRYDCEAQIIKAIEANHVTDKKALDNFQCFEDK